MEVKLEKRYPMPASPAQVWAVLRDVNAVAGCMPGAAITEQIDATHYKGNVKVKVGPANAAFAGDIEVHDLDEATRSVQLIGKGADRGGSTATMDLKAKVEPGESPNECVLIGDASVIVNGKFAQFGGRMMVQVSDMILGQFADNFRIAAAAAPGAVVEAVAVTPPAAGETMAAEAVAASPAPAPAPAAPVAEPPKAHTELNALAIVWMLIKNWFRGLFGNKV